MGKSQLMLVMLRMSHNTFCLLFQPSEEGLIDYSHLFKTFTFILYFKYMHSVCPSG